MDEPDGPETEPTMTVSQEELYAIVRAATRDALYDLVGTVILLAFSLVLLVTSTQLTLQATTLTGRGGGIGLLVIALAIAGWALDVLPPGRR